MLLKVPVRWTDGNRKKARETVTCGGQVTTRRCPKIPRRVLWDFSLASRLRSPSCCPRPPSSPLCCVCCWTLPQSPNCPNCQSSSLQNYLPPSSCHCWEISWLLRKYYCQRSPRSPLRRTGWSCLDTPGWDPCSGSSLQLSWHQRKQRESVQCRYEGSHLETRDWSLLLPVFCFSHEEVSQLCSSSLNLKVREHLSMLEQFMKWD